MAAKRCRFVMTIRVATFHSRGKQAGKFAHGKETKIDE
jgi:hypothetical protein